MVIERRNKLTKFRKINADVSKKGDGLTMGPENVGESFGTRHEGMNLLSCVPHEGGGILPFPSRVCMESTRNISANIFGVCVHRAVGAQKAVFT